MNNGTELAVYDHIDEVPSAWDGIIGNNLYMKRSFLRFMEGIEDCSARYYLIYDVSDGERRLDTIFMTHRRKKYNLGMFTERDILTTMTLVYLPLSVSLPAVVYGRHLDVALAVIKRIRGNKIILNLGDLSPALTRDFARGLTCPRCVLSVKWHTFDEYLSALRSPYRYRYRQALKRSAPLRLEYLQDNRDFTDDMYACYLQVYGKSRIRVEKLPIEFFRNSIFKIFTVREPEAGRVVGFGQMLENGRELIFEFVGLDYAYNGRYDTYHRILLEITRYGIENGFESIDFGQTADDTKLKLGCTYTYLYAYLHHSNPVINAVYKKLAPRLSYRPITTAYRVFNQTDRG